MIKLKRKVVSTISCALASSPSFGLRLFCQLLWILLSFWRKEQREEIAFLRFMGHSDVGGGEFV